MTTTPATARASDRRSGHRGEALLGGRPAVIRAVAALAAIGAALAGTEPTGTRVVDPLLTAAFAAVVTLAAARARRWATFPLPIAALVLASGWTVLFGLLAAVTTLLGARRDRRVRFWGAATAALAMQAMLRAPDLGFHGLSALIVTVAVIPSLVSGYRMCRSGERRRIAWTAVTFAGVVVLIGLAYGALVATTLGDIDQGTEGARQGLTATRQGDTRVAQASFQRSAAGFARADDRLGAWWSAPARAVPVLAQHARALSGAAEEGRELAVTAGDTVTAADYQELRARGGRFDLERINSIAEPLGRTLDAIEQARRSLAADDSAWLLAPLADGLDDLDAELVDAEDEAELASRAVEVAPELLGGDGPRRYFIAFVTPAELRGSGGFMGSWAEITALDGQLSLTRSGSQDDLRAAVPPGGARLTGPEDYLARYGRFDPGEFVGDFTFSPHFPYDARAMTQIYPQAGGAELDGVISVDPIALAALLRFTGPVQVEGFGRALNADNAADFLLRENYRLFPDNDAQNAALAQLVQKTFNQLTTGDLPGPRRIAEVLSPAAAEGRIRLWSSEADEQALFARLGTTGAFPEPRGDRDFLAVASQNSGNNKLDVYQRRSINYRVRVDDGELEATATVTVRNEAPTDASLPDYVIGNTTGDPVGTNRMLLSVYSPHLLQEASLDGSPTAMSAQREAGYRVYTTQIAVPPGGSATLTLELRGSLETDGDYVLGLAPQPIVRSDRLSLDAETDDDQVAVEDLAISGRERVPEG